MGSRRPEPFRVRTEEKGITIMKTKWIGKGRLGLLLCLTGLLCFAVPNVRAGQAEPDQTPPDQAGPDQNGQDQVGQNDAGDPPTRVARISYVDGSVSIQPGGTGDWGSAPLNRPMTIGDKLWTDKDSRAELQTGVVSIHLGSMTALSFLNLDQAITQMRLAEGSMNFRVKEIREGDVYEVDTPNLAFNVTKAGAFRIDVSENGDSTGITIIRGEGQVTASGKTYDLQPGQRGVFDGTNDVQSTIAQAPPPDGLDQWANDRDLREQDSVSAQYVPPDMPGTDDLDDNGTWSEQPDVGPVWYPNDVPDDWAPYSDGNWSYIGPWGWTWVDYEPWGFAPFHYGRWGLVGGRWGWCPGPRIGVSIYGPAYVGFLGGGFGFGAGWFPLGFGEPFSPWYHYGPRYFERVNMRNSFIRNRGIFTAGNFRNYNYAYAHNLRAVTATSRSSFTGGQAIHRGAAHLTDASLRGARVTNDLRLTPGKQSSFGAASARGNVARPPMSVQNRSVMARTAPARGASDMRVRTMNTNDLRPGRAGSFSSNSGANRAPNKTTNQRATNNTRSWAAQGNSTDRGRAPQGFGSSSRGSINSGVTARTNRQDRPPWAGAGASDGYGGSRSTANADRQTNSGGNRSYSSPQRSAPSYNSPPSRSYSAPNRSYSAPSRSYSAPNRSYSAPSRSYSAPSRSYSAPSRTYSAPSRSYGGGGGGSRGGGGSTSRGGGGGGASHGSGGGGGRPHR